MGDVELKEENATRVDNIHDASGASAADISLLGTTRMNREIRTQVVLIVAMQIPVLTHPENVH